MLAVGGITWAYLVDDAFIVARYARNLATGEGWCMNPGLATDGVTGPLWLLPVALAERLGLGAPDVQRALGLAATALAVGLTVRDRMPSRHGAWAPLAALLLVIQATFGVWGGAGLETGFATLALVLLARRHWVERARPLDRTLAVLAAFTLPWLRPELVVAGGVLAVGLALGPRPPVGSEPSRDAGVDRWPALALVAGGLSVVLFRLALFGHPLPLAAMAKLGTGTDGFRYAGVALLLTTGIGGLALVARAWVSAPGRIRARVLILALVGHVVAMAASGGDWMPGHRLVMPVLPIYGVLASWGFLSARHRLRWAGLALAVALPPVAGYVQVTSAWQSGALRQRRGPAVAAAVQGRGPVALVDIGYVGWRSGVEVVDLGGLTDPVIAAAPGGHLRKRVPLGYLVHREPRTILLHSATPPAVDDVGRLTGLAGYPVEQRVAALPWVRAHFRVGATIPYAEGYTYVRLDRIEPGAE